MSVCEVVPCLLAPGQAWLLRYAASMHCIRQLRAVSKYSCLLTWVCLCRCSIILQAARSGNSHAPADAGLTVLPEHNGPA